MNPEGKIPEDSSRVHRIRNSDVGRAPRFEEIANFFAAKIDCHVLVAHNLLRFDLPILKRYFPDYSSVEFELGGGICALENFPANPDRGFRKKLPDLCAVQGVAFDPDLLILPLEMLFSLRRPWLKGYPISSTPPRWFRCNPG